MKPQAHLDKNAGLPTAPFAGRRVTAFEPTTAAVVCERLAEGRLLKSICTEAGMPRAATFMRWVVLYPELRKAYEAALLLSARTFEEEALDLALGLKDAPGSPQRVRAHEIAIQQLRWSAERRDPGAFGAQKQVSIKVPIQINTNLDLGDPDKGARIADIYNVTATVMTDAPDPPAGKPLLSAADRRLGPKKKVLTPRTLENADAS